MNAEFKNIVCPEISSKYGAKIGRSNIEYKDVKPIGRIHDVYVPMCGCCGAYDIGGVYWGNTPNRLRCRFSECGKMVHYYRENNETSYYRGFKIHLCFGNNTANYYAVNMPTLRNPMGHERLFDNYKEALRAIDKYQQNLYKWYLKNSPLSL